MKMYQVSDAIATQNYEGLHVKKILSNDNLEILMISIESGNKFPEHTSPRDAFLVMLEGEIEFHINQETYRLKRHQTFDFQAKIKHWVYANENSKFLIIR